MGRPRFTITFKETVQGRELDFYYVGGHYRFSANTKKAHGFYKQEKAEELLKQMQDDGYGEGRSIVVI